MKPLLMIRLGTLFCTLTLISCTPGKDMCEHGTRLTVHDTEQYGKLITSLDQQDIEFISDGLHEICYENKNHSLVTSTLIKIRSETHPVGRVELARGMEDEVIDLLESADIRFVWSVEDDKLVLIIDQEDYGRADKILDELFSKKFSGEPDAKR